MVLLVVVAERMWRKRFDATWIEMGIYMAFLARACAYEHPVHESIDFFILSYSLLLG